MLLQAKQDIVPPGVAEGESRITVGPTAIRELDEGTAIAGIGKREGEDFADRASRPFAADLSKPLVVNDLVGLPAKSQLRHRIEVDARPDSNSTVDIADVQGGHLAGSGKSLDHVGAVCGTD